MRRSVLLSVLAITIVHCYAAVQVQMPEAAELNQPDDDLQTQIQKLQKNVSDIWNYISELRTAVSSHLTHLRVHQMELESSMHKMEHLHEGELRSSGYHHSGEQHSHSGEQHSHSGEHSHGGDHSHGAMEQHGHSHSGEHHSHSGEHHSHSGEHHSHSYSHSHGHSGDDSHSHGGDHKDSHEVEDLQTQQVAAPDVEAPIVPAVRQEHYHHHSHSQSHSSSSHDGMNLINDFHHHHHHDHGSGSRGRNRTVELPKYSDYGQYDLALCRVEPNRALPEDQQQDITGTITLWQKKSGGPLNLHVRLQGFDVGGHHGHHGQQALQKEDDSETQQAVGHRHGFHIHASGDLSNGCQSTGPHYNPKSVNHGGPDALERHVGDLGSIECDEHGNTNILFGDDVASLRGQYSVIGKAIVIHSKEDDRGLGGDAGSLATGNAGSRLACCVIQKVEKIPIRQYKAMKSAVQFQNR